MLLHHQIVEHGVLRGEYLETDYASFAAWQHWGRPPAGVRDCFGAAAILTADGAFLLGVMGPHTLNAGEIYFPCGTPDPADIIDGKVDLDLSIRRELKEETGLDIAVGRPILISDTIDPNGYRHVVNITFLATVTGGSITDAPSDPRVEAVDLVAPGELASLDLRPPMADALLDVFIDGDALGKPHLFPNVIVKTRDSAFKDPEQKELLFKVHQLFSKYGTPYILNMLPDWQHDAVNSMGCRTRLSGDWADKMGYENPAMSTMRTAPTSLAIAANRSKSMMRGYAEAPAMIIFGLCSLARRSTSS